MSTNAPKGGAWQRAFEPVDDDVGGRLHMRERTHRNAMARAGALASSAAGRVASGGLFGPSLTVLPPHPLTAHAAHRLKNRGITHQQLELITAFGRPQRAHGATRYALDRKARQLIEQTLAPAALLKLRSLDIVAVVADDGALITVSHRTQRLRRDLQRH